MGKNEEYGSHIYCLEDTIEAAKRELLLESREIAKKQGMKNFQVTIETRGPDIVNCYAVLMKVKEKA